MAQILFPLAGSLIVILLSIVGFMLGMAIKESRQNTLEIGKLQGAVQANREKAHDDNAALENATNLKMQHMTDDIGMLTRNVDRLVDAIIKKN